MEKHNNFTTYFFEKLPGLEYNVKKKFVKSRTFFHGKYGGGGGLVDGGSGG